MKHLFAFALLAGGLTLAGCSDDKPKGDLPALHPAKGKVLRGGVPAPGGTIQLKPATLRVGAEDLMVNAELMPDGTFELQTIHALSMKKGVGAPAGTYKATYIPSMAESQNVTPVPVPKLVTIVEGPNELTIEIPAKKR